MVARSPTDLVAMPPSLLPLSLPTVRRALAPSLASPTFGPAAAMEPGVRLAGVCAVLREVPGDVEVLVIRRGEREGDPWSGHMALPGGRFEPEDLSVYTTAVRETHEEVGIDLSDADKQKLFYDNARRILNLRDPAPAKAPELAFAK